MLVLIPSFAISIFSRPQNIWYLKAGAFHALAASSLISNVRFNSELLKYAIIMSDYMPDCGLYQEAECDF